MGAQPWVGWVPPIKALEWAGTRSLDLVTRDQPNKKIVLNDGGDASGLDWANLQIKFVSVDQIADPLEV